jgi:hypothetical protein
MTDLGTDFLKEKKKKALKHIADLSNEAQIKVEEEKKKEYYVQKYKGNEAILSKGLPYFLEIVEDRVILHDEIVLPDMVLKPYNRIMYLNKEYSFNSLEEIEEYIAKARQESFDTLYLKVKDIWSKYIDTDNDHLTICAADTIFTYFQDKLGMTHYLLFVGDNGSGKSNNLKVFQYLGYRALFDTSITAANIHQFYGSIEEGQGIILEDEADSIDQDISKMKIYKVGYQSGTKVTRMDLSNGRKQDSYWTYGFKALSAERQPNNTKAKGFMERVFVLSCSTGDPKYDITEVINPAGDKNQAELFEELNNMRKLLLIFRLVNQDRPIPDIKLTVKNRDKQLCKPLLRLFQDSKCVQEIAATLSKLLAEKRQRKSDTLDARLFEIIINLIGEKGTTELDNTVIWESFKDNIEGYYDPNKPLSYETEEFYTVSQKRVTDILVDKFGAIKGHDSKTGKNRALRFNQNILKRLEPNYSSAKPIEILKPSDTSNTSDRSRGNKEDINEEKIDIIKHEIAQTDTLNQPKNRGICASNPSELSKLSASNHDIYRLGASDKWACNNCNYKEDRHFFDRSDCPGNKRGVKVVTV